MKCREGGFIVEESSFETKDTEGQGGSVFQGCKCGKNSIKVSGEGGGRGGPQGGG